MIRNLNYVFNVQYYDYLASGETNDVINNHIIGYEMQRKTALRPPQEHHFYLTTLYPGLLTGLGYAHEVGKEYDAVAKEAVKLGFSFNYVSGEPYIPSSSVKGLLRSAFDCPAYIAECLGIPLGEGEIEQLKKEIFGADCNKGEITMGKDVFLDAVLDYEKNREKFIMGLEYITPHFPKTDNPKEREQLAGLTNPIPLRLLKVMPNIVFLFEFILTDTYLSETVIITAKQKQKLFEQIILDFGAGAKTNVGFGGFEKYVANAEARGYVKLTSESSQNKEKQT